MEQAILNYRYVSQDDSILAPYYKTISTYCIDYIPINMSPNLITLIGLTGVFVSTFITIFLKNYIGLLATCVICSTLLLFYQIMDTLDGMQGKRVNMYYNPTTELFDHGCDSITTTLVLYNLLNLTNSINQDPLGSIILILCTLINFYLPTWQHANTKIMHFRGGFFNPTESIFFIKILYICIGLFPSIFCNFYVVRFFLLNMIVSTIYHTYVSVVDTYKTTKKTYFNTTLSFVPLLMSYQFVIYSIAYGHYDGFYINTSLSLLIAILNLIWYEISETEFDIYTSFLAHVFASCQNPLSAICAIGLYIYLFRKYTIIMCKILKMETFYSIPKN
ncbi:CDP-alcohol phosphatidyltransferase [Catovirus CTV1]|uniref:CDP-alcohol phosphatidyltransferase n=1 Tax=Catovirus CTV1 TaxID=1977631 RepID=A0A1V0SAF3_9VIRU|nr:CDP-alcohol phosphatidyltransferase [Catovirus CTV1]